MDNVTLTAIYATFGLAALLFVVGVGVRNLSRAGVDGLPPAIPQGKIPIWFYRNVDLLPVGLIVAFYLAQGALTASMTDEPKASKITADVLIINMGVQFFWVAVATIVVFQRVRPVEWLGLNWRQWPWVIFIGPVTVFGMWFVFAMLYLVGYQQLLESLGVKKVQDMVEMFQKTEDQNVLVLMVVMAVIVAPVCEEVVFRGYLYPVLKKFSGMWIGLLVSALIFSAAHGSFVALLPLFIFGVVLAFLYEWTGSIWAPIAAHLLFNGATVGIQLLVRFGYIPEQALQ
jgi:membrane protease YdiL (CAAX protease family)